MFKQYHANLASLLLLFAGTDALAQAAPAPQPLSRATFIATMDVEFKKLDLNHDGSVTRPEVDAQQQRMAEQAATRRAQAAFAVLDADRNGQISAAEFVRATVAQLPKSNGAQAMARLDANRDQKVSPVEHRILTLTNFDRLDADRDGILTVAEQRAGGLIK